MLYVTNLFQIFDLLEFFFKQERDMVEKFSLLDFFLNMLSTAIVTQKVRLKKGLTQDSKKRITIGL